MVDVKGRKITALFCYPLCAIARNEIGQTVMNSNTFVSHSIVKEFLETAERFCSLIENHSDLSTYQFANQLSELLPLLYRLGHLLPDVEPTTSDGTINTVPSNKHAAMREEIGAKFGKFDLYREVFDLYNHLDDDPVMMSIGDDISDIYSELKPGLSAYSLAPLDAVWNWKFGFLNHWGRHLVSSLRAIQYLFSHFLLTETKIDDAGNGT